MKTAEAQVISGVIQIVGRGTLTAGRTIERVREHRSAGKLGWFRLSLRANTGAEVRIAAGLDSDVSAYGLARPTEERQECALAQGEES